jgi:hypothetical protein
MAQIASNEFGAVTWSQLVWTPTRGLIGRLWQQTGKCAATMNGKVRCWAQRQRDQVLPPPDLWHQQCRRDILRIEARRIL